MPKVTLADAADNPYGAATPLPVAGFAAGIPAGATLLTASGSTTTGGTITATITAGTGTAFIMGIDATVGIGAATASVLVTSTAGLATTLRYSISTSTTSGGVLNIRFPQPIPATAAATNIVIQLPAIGGGAAVNAITIYGYTQ